MQRKVQRHPCVLKLSQLQMQMLIRYSHMPLQTPSNARTATMAWPAPSICCRLAHLHACLCWHCLLSSILQWTVYRGVAYDLTSFIDRHPAGSWLINLAIGRDCTALFESYHLRPEVAVAHLKRLPVLEDFPVDAVPRWGLQSWWCADIVGRPPVP